MSELERNRGSLCEVGTATEMQGDMDECDFSDYLSDKGMMEIGGKVYTATWKVKSEREGTYFADVEVDEDGIIHFHTMHYNGGGSLEEVIEGELKKLKEK